MRAQSGGFSGGFSSSFQLGGMVGSPKSYALADLQALPVQTETVDFMAGDGAHHVSYTGALLWDLVSAAGPQFDPNTKNDQLRWYVRIDASDGYEAIVALGEIAPNFEHKPVLVAYMADGALLGPSDGMARLVVPGDTAGGRYVSNITNISVLRADQPAAAQPSAAAARAQPMNQVVIYHAGSLTDAVQNAIGPGFTAASGYPFTDTAGPSVMLANQIRSGQINPDVFMSADAEAVNLLIGPQNGDKARWFLVMGRTRMVIAYSPKSRFKADLDAAAAGQLPWYQVLQEPGFVLKRGDPRTDPSGYRDVFVFELAERYYGIPGLANAIMGSPDNDEQITSAVPDGLNDGSVDAYVSYITTAQQSGLPYIQLPDEVDQSNTGMADIYAAVSYTNPQGQTFHGTPAVYGVTIPTGASNEAGAEAFVRYLFSDSGRQAL
ncbi:MAG TPA: extracellular solute-binding protein, partial [Dehalococcoidia bacterium]